MNNHICLCISYILHYNAFHIEGTDKMLGKLTDILLRITEKFAFPQR